MFKILLISIITFIIIIIIFLLFIAIMNNDIIISSKKNIENFALNNTIPWGAYFADDWTGNTLLDSSGNSRHATTFGTITKLTGNGNGATGSITYISGGTSSIVSWPYGSIPANFTILSLTRYNGGTRRRILSNDRSGGNFLHGHWQGYRGVCHYDYWMTPTYRTLGILDDWLCCIGKNSSVNPNNILMDGIPSGTNINGNGGYRLAINDNPWGETSDWALSCVIIYDSILSDADITLLNNHINTYKSSGNLQQLKSNILGRSIKSNIVSITGANNRIFSVNNNDNYSYAYFSKSGTFTTNTDLTCDILIVGGGGGGGRNDGWEGGGGGGGGGVGIGTINLRRNIIYTISIGSGGNGAINGNTIGNNGLNTSIIGDLINETAYGGGGGGWQTGVNGGSGGGGSGHGGNFPAGTATKGISSSGTNSSITYYGNNGGYGYWNAGGSGGGGAGGAGATTGRGGNMNGANGGIGIISSITGTDNYYGGGGGGATGLNGGSQGIGGLGGGGKGGNRSNPTSGENNTGGGGGGSTGGAGGNGGSGVIIIRYNEIINGEMSDIAYSDIQNRLNRNIINASYRTEFPAYIFSSSSNSETNKPLNLFNEYLPTNVSSVQASFASNRYSLGNFIGNNKDITLPNYNRNSQLNIILKSGEYLYIRFPRQILFSRYSFVAKDINNAPASWVIYNINDLIEIDRQSVTKSDYIDNVYTKNLTNPIFTDTNIIIVFTRTIGGNTLNFGQIKLESEIQTSIQGSAPENYTRPVEFSF